MTIQRFRIHFIFTFLTAFSLLLFSCEDIEVEPTLNEEEVSDDFNVDAQKLLSLVNQYRKEGCTCGSEVMPPVPTLTWSETLAKIAYLHSEDMDEKNYFSHTGKDGSNPGERMQREGYNWRAYGENIAKGYSNEEEVIRGWIDSKGHCKNIMNANVEEMGVGRKGEYWTQVFGRR